ncbi:MAG: STAS/SEC14 domain-containing protein [Pseudaminobacter sp.]
MHPLDAVPAIRRIETDRGDLCALEIVGRFTAADLENAYGLLQGAYAEHEKIDLLVRITHYDGFDWGSAFTEATIRGKTEALRHIRKYAVVGGPGWMRVMIGIFGPLTSIETRYFDLSDEAEAWQWVGGEPA